MISLKECLELYSALGLSDTQIIEQYFIRNHLEDEAIKLLSNLTEKQFKKLHYNSSIRDFYRSQLSCFILSRNEYAVEEDKERLYLLIEKYLFVDDLNKEELKETKEIFKRNKISVCPKQFYDYINGIENDDTKLVRDIRGE